MSDTISRMNDIIYRVGEWSSPPLWPPAYRRWKKKAQAELHRLYNLRCEEVADLARRLRADNTLTPIENPSVRVNWTTEYSVLVAAEAQPLTVLPGDAVDAFIEAMTEYHGCCSFSQETAPVPTFSCRFNVYADNAATACSNAAEVFRQKAFESGMPEAVIEVIEAQTVSSLEHELERPSVAAAVARLKAGPR